MYYFPPLHVHFYFVVLGTVWRIQSERLTKIMIVFLDSASDGQKKARQTMDLVSIN